MFQATVKKPKICIISTIVYIYSFRGFCSRCELFLMKQFRARVIIDVTWNSHEWRVIIFVNQCLPLVLDGAVPLVSSRDSWWTWHISLHKGTSIVVQVTSCTKHAEDQNARSASLCSPSNSWWIIETSWWIIETLKKILWDNYIYYCQGYFSN